MEKTELKGTVEKITYRNRDNGYTVFKIRHGKKEVTCVGSLPAVSEGDTVTVTGSYSNHSIYGEQFNVETIDISAPKTQLQVLKYLSSGAIKGIGPATAIKIVEKFKENTLDIIENYPLELTVIRGISREKALAISEEYKRQFGMRDIFIALASFNITPIEAADIFKVYGVRSVDLIRENPYCLCIPEIGFSFERVEEISDSLGLPDDSDGRLTAGILYILRSNLRNGHTCLPYDKLLSVAEKLLSVNKILIEDTIKQMSDRMEIALRLYGGSVFVFLYEYFAAEEYIASRLAASIDSNVPMYEMSELEIKLVQKKLGIEFDDKQKDAVNGSLFNNVFVITGGPGTGKTTTLNALISVLSGRKLSIALAAPTGRAAKRIQELTGYEAKTLHRLLEVDWSDRKKQSFAKNRKNPLDEEVIIVDEMSMVDTLLFKALLDATRTTSRIILIGDSDQLPSVGAGNVLGDIIDSGLVPSIRLDKVFRQSDTSDIIKNAHLVIAGNIPDLSHKSKDFFFIKNYNPELSAASVTDLVNNRLPTAYGFSSFEDIQVLCPSKKMTCGSYNLNLILQESLNPLAKDKNQLFYKGVSFREGDKVMQNKNDYDISWTADNGEVGTGVFNGDIGTVVSVDAKNKILSVRFDDRVAVYFDEELEVLELAYAITVHKSQGSEFPCVIIPLVDSPKQLRYRNLLYTAITRAKKILVFVGNEQILSEMTQNDRKTLRYTGLRFMLENYDS